MGKKKSSLWCFTNFNLDLDYQEIYNYTSARYIAYGLETCPSTGRSHHQGFVYFENDRSSYKGVSKDFGGCHVEMCLGALDQNQDYCIKQGDLIEIGSKPSQGKRTDLVALKDKILRGETCVDQIVLDEPNTYHQYGRTLHKIEDIRLRGMFRTEMTKGIWIWGPTGVGKSHYAFNNYHPETHYVFPNDGGWWDGYVGQEIVIINEFRGGIPFAELLDLVDKWPKHVKRRGREPVPFLAKTLIITSSLPPDEVYFNVSQTDSLNQLLRRFEIIKMAEKCSEGNTEPQSQKLNLIVPSNMDLP